MFESVDFSKSKQYSLSIRLGTDGFSFSIANPLDDRLPEVQTFPVQEELPLTANLKLLFREHGWLQHPFRRINLLIPGKRHTLVPLELFDEEQTEQLFHYNLPPQNNERILYNILQKSGIVTLFGIDKSAAAYLHEQLPDAHLCSSAGTLIEYFSVKSRQGNSRKMYAYLRKESAELFCYERGKLLLTNSYTCKETSDFIYYLLYTWKQLDFEQQRDELFLCGELPDKTALLERLRKFIMQVSVIPSSEHFDLQAITLCE
ncbi:MAG: DUF3822 family protein [Mediterranea sp.]|nr:DUF3822 family protein [Mediterranea sp.]